MKARRTWRLPIVLLALGVVTLAYGAYLETRNPRSNSEDDAAWLVLAIGAFLIGVAVALPFTRPAVAVLVGLVCPFIGFTVLVAIVWGYIILNALIR